MVQVTHAAPVLTGIVVGTEGLAVLVGPGQRAAAIVVAADVGRFHFIGLALVHLDGEGHPVVDGLAVVDDHVGNRADALILKGIDHRPQLRLVAERAAVVDEPEEVIIAHRLAAAITALRYPHEFEKLRQLIGLSLKLGPLRLAEGVPIEALQHHAAILCGPPLCRRQQRHQEGNK